MATSLINTTLPTVRDIIRGALREIGATGIGQEPSAEDYELARDAFNWMLKDWQNNGLNLWRDDEMVIPWPAFTAEGDLDQKYLDITELRVADASGFERPLNRMESSAYALFPNKLTTGSTPYQYTLSRNTTTLTVKLWPVPNVDVTLYGSGSRVIYDVVGLNENADLPQQYTRTAILCLAVELIAAFGKANDPNAALTVQRAQSAKTKMFGDDRPASYFLGTAMPGYSQSW